VTAWRAASAQLIAAGEAVQHDGVRLLSHRRRKFVLGDRNRHTAVAMVDSDVASEAAAPADRGDCGQ
jgi:hypothetical protein